MKEAMRQRLEKECQALHGVFRKRHLGNPRLRAEVLRLVDAYGAFSEYRGKTQFYLGFQISLELGRLEI